MCGISGILVRRDNKVRLDEIKKMNDLIIHRGPDDEGIFLEENLGFGHRRLSILDLSSDGHQPMSYLDRYVITYNGEVYNYLEIREELEKDGYSFKSHTDTEVIIASYDKWGEECVNKFNGMWAFAIYDRVKQNVFCSRDRFGIKPFYYAQIEDKFIFASEIKQLLPFFSKNIVNKNNIMDFILYGKEEYNNETFFKDVYKLEQSHNLVYDLKLNSFKINNYYNLSLKEEIQKLNEQDSIELFRETFDNAICLRLRSDVKVGTCLSGGLDSSSIATIASSLYFSNSSEQFNAITAKSTEKKTDETLYAKKVVEESNLNWSIIEPSSKEFIENIDEVIYTQEEPFGGPSIFMQYFVMKKAKEIGCTVMLDGQGADETLVGYESYFPFYIALMIKEFNFLKALETFIYMKNFKLSRKKILLTTVSILFGKKISFLRQFYRSKKYGESFKNKTENKNFKNFFTFQYEQIMKLNLAKLLKYEDKNSMRHSIETRLPFVDVNTVEVSLSINCLYKIKNGYTKYILRKSMENKMENSITWRYNKFGFEAPSETWIKEIEDFMFDSISKSEILSRYKISLDSINKKDKALLWRLFSISVWEKVYDVKS
ncbi:asparagine synthase (glutamine-hydrolyzing) [Halarcobacter sp.]|uniref:asparagine synthase (glutamine-hydrolyzing) n=1 Tax=Halarcobacter sp. TaxID=2321133 RepID=UPI003B001B3A